jgi:transcriptional regulator with XRE-family HTH domain
MKKLKILQISDKFKSIKSLSSWILGLGAWSSQIKTIRETLGMSQQQLANKISSTQKTISKIEGGIHNPKVDTLKRIADSLDCELIISFIPHKPIIQNIENKAEIKAKEIISQSVANAAMESQKPNKKLIKLNEQELKEELIKNNRDLLW